ncbi:hypothetical protein HJC23_007898 [Cyclotella cryptica]|uniref:Glycosyltransferase 61 catalytic domain-containing protein n=1 Tax=Cyclotella cryptica TaxID=29204 RepID=A0ABD3R0Y8_9STRA|eukprot:CCRYP_000252-RA/>CCRYP_000252-RA protein AED:0.15 eAED:0.15 QI:0/-1/0/1/-1/1/1/0/500
MPLKTSRPPRFKTLNRKASRFKRHLLALLSGLAVVNYTVILLLHSQANNWMASYQGLFLPTNPDGPRKQIGIGSRHFPSMAHRHNVSRDCHDVASDAVLDTWKNDSQIVCSVQSPPNRTAEWFSTENTSILVEEYVLRSWEYEPTFVRYQNVEGYWGGGIGPLPCPRAALRHEHLGQITHVRPPWAVDPPEYLDYIRKRNASDIIQVYDTVLLIQMFEQHNSYERLHAYLNAAMVMRMFDIANPQLVLMLGKGIMTPNTLEMWRSMSTLEPIVVDMTKPHSPMDGERRKLFRELIHLSSPGTSILVTVAGSFRGRGTDHHCKSTLFRDITQWTAMNFDIDMKRKMGNVTQIVWSSRSPYCCVNNQTLFVKRSMNDEDRLLQVLTEYLGPWYSITKVDFGTISTRKSIEIASQTDILMGVHGAGLIWAGFMPIHGGLVEIFGGDRANNNRHYHNLASLADLHYRELSLRGMDPIRWDNGTAKELVRLIQSIEPKHKKLEPD